MPKRRAPRGVLFDDSTNAMSMIALLASSPALFTGACLVLGLIVGSFLNVVIHRVPIMLERQWREQCAELAQSGHDATVPAAFDTSKDRYNLIVPRSACPACKAPITALQNVPIVSYLILRGRCARCGVHISLRYPIVEALTGVLSAAVACKLGFAWPTAAALVLTWFLVALAFIDIDHQLLPDSLTLPLLWLGLLLSLFGPAPGGAPLPADVRSSIIGAIAGYVCLWSVYHLFRLLTAKEGMGYGDFKLLAAIGAWLGWQMLLPTVLIAAAVGAVAGIALLAARGQSRSTPIAFGPFLAAAGWLMLMFGRELVTGYLGLFTH
jgi:leader peptidase (prepilin peptidase) / N-methyltransferase